MRVKFETMSEADIRRQAKIMKAMRYIAPLMAALICFIIINTVPQWRMPLLFLTIFMIVAEFYIFDYLYKKAATVRHSYPLFFF